MVSYLEMRTGDGVNGSQALPRISELPALLTVEQACRVLGVSRSAGYRAAAAGHMPTIRWGHRIYIPTARLLAMLGIMLEEPP